LLLLLAFNEYSNETMHVLVPFIVLLFITVELLAKEAVPIALELTLRGLTEQLSFKLYEVFLLLIP